MKDYEIKLLEAIRNSEDPEKAIQFALTVVYEKLLKRE